MIIKEKMRHLSEIIPIPPDLDEKLIRLLEKVKKKRGKRKQLA